MGNAAAPRMCHEAAAAAGRRSGNADAEAAAAESSWQGGKVKVGRRWRRGVEEEVEQQRAGGSGGGADGSAAVMTVKVVMTRKEAEKLIARLDEQSARKRKARMAELTGRFRTGDDGGGRSPEAAACTPKLPPIQEN